MSNGGQKSKSSSSFHFLAGLSSGVTTAFLLQPADLLKTRVQQSRTSSLTEALRSILAGPHPIRQLWRGTTPSVIRTGAGSALYFGMLNQLRQHAAMRIVADPTASATSSSSSSSSRLPKLGNWANLATGALARASAGFVLSPVTVLKVRYESSYYAYTSLAGAARDVAAKEGIKGFFAGFGATAVRDAPYAGLYVLFYEQAKTKLAGLAAGLGRARDAGTATGSGLAAVQEVITQPSLTTATGINFVSGAVAAVSATAITNPFDAIKTRLQLMPQRYGNMVRAAKMMLKEEGVRSLFDGLGLRMGRKAVSSALAWTVYEELIRRAESGLVV